MIVHVEMHEREAHAGAVQSYFRLRKKVFHDRLGWEVPVEGNVERDPLDDLPCTYALSIAPDGRVDAGIRLIPTTQTTLLDLAFDGLVPDAVSFRSPAIWELSRYCVDHDRAAGRLPVGLGLATLQLTLANVDYARRNGITHFIAVTEERVHGLTRQFDLGAEVLARRNIDGCDVVCTLFTIDDRAVQMARQYRRHAQGSTDRPQLSGKDAMSRAPAPAGSRPDPETAEPTKRSRRA